MNVYSNLTALGLAAIMSMTSLTACSQKPSSEEIAAQVKVAMEQIEKDKQAAAAQGEQTRSAAPAEAPAQKPASKHAAAKSYPPVYEQRRTAPPAESARPVCANCGIVLAVNVIEEEGKGSGVGMVAGGVVGGLLGNQVGKGTGRDVATIAGVVGGAYAGNKIEKMSKTTKSYHIAVRMDDGSERTYRQPTDPGLAKGQRVKIENNTVVKY